MRKVDYMFCTKNQNIKIVCASTIMRGTLPSVHVTPDKCIVPFMNSLGPQQTPCCKEKAGFCIE